MAPLFPAFMLSAHPKRVAARRRRRIFRPLVLASLMLGSTLVGPAANADTGYGYCHAAGCNGLDPQKENCGANAWTVSSITYTYGPDFDDYTGKSYELDLRYSPDCEANWARVVSATAVRFCVWNNQGKKDEYTSAPGVVSWTNMVNGAYPVSDTAALWLPTPTTFGNNILWANDQGGSPGAPNTGLQVGGTPCW